MKSFHILFALILAVLGITLVISGGSKEKVLMYMKSRGYLEYTSQEAQELAYTKCKQCHPIDKITKYCMRCGPPFIIVTHNMKKLISIEKQKPGTAWIDYMTDAEANAMTEVWNAIVGNWEDTWRKEDLKKLLENDKAMLKLLDTPVKERKIETALKGKTAEGVHETMKPLPKE
ncbi:MAG: hypothetical protein HZB79_04200 [Deltaproteobacteria bacterium]|nr:hypothetical protein [Deltaproteobacteria bacterium]